MTPAEVRACRSILSDPRKPRGVRHGLVYVLALAACAVLTGATSLLAISEWAADASLAVLHRIGARRCPLTGIRLLAARWGGCGRSRGGSARPARSRRLP
ncbi:transposase family protein [Streptomyces sp. NBC_01264]|uniref:transposase family protein n=1 Tax=Streptomyces sp. NBC_01264 TaxID=2903804 RepID=UPI0022546AEF|nr:transposase family protein [Streptomyces sp. NBC_01264]MCX4781663.1 transposase family protein [Streptomyces sp. NBC_01264]